MKIKPMKPEEYYEGMRSIKGCNEWAKSVGITMKEDEYSTEYQLKGSRTETDISLYFDMDEDDLDLINCLNRLRRWYEHKDEV